MKKIILTTMICGLTILGFAQQKESIKWMSFNEASVLAQETPKKIFIDVFTDWCGWCKKMDKTTFQDSAIVSYMNDNFYAVKFDAEGSDTIVFQNHTFVNTKQGNRNVHQFAAALLQGKMSYPSYVFLNEQMQPMTVVPGYADAKQFLPILDFFGSDAYQTIGWEDFLSNWNQQKK